MLRIAALFLVIFAQTAIAEPSAGCASQALSHSSGEYQIVHKGLERRYLLDLPAIERDGPPALLLALHGYTGSPEFIGAPTTEEFVSKASQAGYVLVRPASTVFTAQLNPSTAKTIGFIADESEWPELPESERRVEVASWNDLAGSKQEGPAGPICLPNADTYPCPPECGDCEACVWASCHDDVGFIQALVGHLDEQLCFDRSQRFVLGHSNGGMMAHALTCELPALFAGGASIKGQPEIGYACSNPASPPFIQITGAQDTTVPQDGGPASDGFLYETSHHSAEVRAQALECDTGAQMGLAKLDRPLDCTLWEECEAGRRVADCVDPQGGHEWPSHEPQGNWGIDLIFEFWKGSEILQTAGDEDF